MNFFSRFTCCQLVLVLYILILAFSSTSLAATTEIHIVKYANDKSTILAEKTLTYQQMRDTLPVLGDGSTHYYHQGPVFMDDPDEVVEQQLRWNSAEDTNVDTKDMGAVKGTNVRDLCELVGGMAPGDTVVIMSGDGMSKEYAYKNVYLPSSRQGPIVVTWYCSGISSCSGPYPDSGYSDGMRLVFFADNSVNPWGEHVFGNFDWHESADPEYWYYYISGGEKYPTTTGLSVKYVSEIQIYSSKSPSSTSSDGGTVPPAPGSTYSLNTAFSGYRGQTLITSKSGTLNGSLRLFSDPIAEPVVVNNRLHEFHLTVDLPPDSNITLARLYVYISKSHNLQTNRGTIPSFYIQLNTTFLEPDKMYFDSDGDDNKQVSATCAYDVRDLLNGNGTYTLSIHNIDLDDSTFTVDNVLLVTTYEYENSKSTSYWINEGCDVIFSQPEKGLFPDNSKTSYPFSGTVNMSIADDAGLYLISTGLDHDNSTEHTVSFNDKKWYNIFDTERYFDNESNSSFIHLPVRTSLNETGNAATVQSSISSQDADYLVNRNAFLIVEHTDLTSPASVHNTTMSEQVQLGLPDSALDSPLEMNESRCCKILLDSDPEGALVYIDGTYLGKTTPSSLDVKKGDTHTVRFELDGYFSSTIQFTAMNSTSIRPSLWAPVYSTKGRMVEEPEDPDGIHYGGLYVHSRPHSAMIFINGVDTGKTTPAIFMGLEPGSYTIKLGKVQDIAIYENNLFNFQEQTVWVLPGEITPVDINGIGYHEFSDIIIDSHRYRGLTFTVNGYMNNKTVPAKIRSSLFESFITIHENESYISYPVPVPYVWDEDRYLLFEPRDHQNLDITVNSSPRGAEVFIDGFRTGYSTPYTFGNISDGAHRITVTKNGYLPQQSIIDLPRRAVPISTTSVNFILEEYPSGFLYVNSIPEGGRVSIDSVFTGEITPALFKTLPTGAHLVEVQGINSTKTFYDVTINSLEMSNLTADFSPIED